MPTPRHGHLIPEVDPMVYDQNILRHGHPDLEVDPKYCKTGTHGDPMTHDTLKYSKTGIHSAMSQ